MSRSLLRCGHGGSFALLVACLVVLSGCYYSASGYSYSITVTAVADHDTAFAGMTVSLMSDYDVDNAEVYITDHDWGVTSAPVAAVYAFDDDGRDATLLPVTPGTYVVRYRTWYYTNYDYYDCHCTHYSSYRESYVTVTILPAPST